MPIKVCILIFGDSSQYSDYKDFKGDLEEHVTGKLDINDVLDIAGKHPDNQSKAIRDYIVNKDAVILVCSAKLNACISGRYKESFKLRGRNVEVDGNVLNEMLREDSVKRKTILVSMSPADKQHVPDGYEDNPHFDAESDDVNDEIMFSILGILGSGQSVNA